MGVGSVISTFVMCILFNILLPTGDIGSDLNLMHQTLSFNLGDSIELEGCKSCYFKLESDMYNPKKDLPKKECKTCFHTVKCGSMFPFFKNLKELNERQELCLNDESFRITNKGILHKEECDESQANNNCCVRKTVGTKSENPINMLDPKKIFFSCRKFTSTLPKDLEFCLAAGKASGSYCDSLWKYSNFTILIANSMKKVLASSTDETVFFFPYSWFEQSWVMEEKSFSITDPDIECGLLFYDHSNDGSKLQLRKQMQKLAPNKLFDSCLPITEELEFCGVFVKESYDYCNSFVKDNDFKEQYKNRLTHILTSQIVEKIFFYPYSLINQTVKIEEKNHSFTDPNVKCGLLFYRHNKQDKPWPTGWSNYYCYDDTCVAHLSSLHYYTSITNLTEWRKKTDYFGGVKIGGATCGLLQIYGKCILIPIILNFFFNVILFFNDYKEEKANLFESLPLILLFYPQYKTVKFLSQYLFIHRDENLLNKGKEENDKTVAPLEPFLESCFQVSDQSI